MNPGERVRATEDDANEEENEEGTVNTGTSEHDAKAGERRRTTP